MLYLEDYLELIENLPLEMRERFTDMREADLEVQNTLDSLEDRTRIFFKKCTQTSVKADWKEEQYGKIKEDYTKAVDQSDEKVQIANQIYDMVDRHLRRLDIELNKFKMELEADNAGITELLEKRSLELDNVPKENNPPREKRKYTQQNQAEKRVAREGRIPTTIVHDKIESKIITPDSSNPNSPNTLNSNHSTSSANYSLGQTSAAAGNAAIRAAASQAIAATQNMQPGRRTSSLKASIELAKNSDQWSALSDSLTNPSPTSSQTEQGSRSQRLKKHTQKAEALILAQQAKKQSQQSQHSTPSVVQVMDENSISEEVVVEDNNPSSNPDWTYDPNEPRYCICNQVSYGEMVGCDNNDCTVEWFHYGCVQLKAAPKGKWYCPQCTANMKRRGGRK